MIAGIINNLGFREITELDDIDSQLVSKESARLRFMSSYVKGDFLLRVSIDSVILKADGPNQVDSVGMRRNIDILIDPDNGHIVRIHIKDDRRPTNDKQAAYVYVEQVMKPIITGTSFLGFPDSLPQFGLKDVINNAVNDISIPAEVVIYYVLLSDEKSDIFPVWIVDLAGVCLTERQKRLGMVDDGLGVNHIQKVYNAITGELLFFMVYGEKRE